MKNRVIVSLLSAALAAPCMFVIGCDKEVSHDETTVKRADGTSKHEETTVKEKPDGSIEKTTEKQVDNKPK